MVCRACGHGSEPRAKFCAECGARLEAAGVPAATARSWQPPTPGDHTPSHLAERILAGRAALQGERKAVTVLFADIQGSLTLAEQVDAEDWDTMMRQFYAILAGGVHRFEGTVNQYTGDGIMALFGAPLAHEDHAQRACHAALDLVGALREYAHTLRRERGLQLSVRIGLNSGEVVVGTIGDDLRMEYTAQGHTVGLAARMEQLCEPGRVYVTEHTAALVEGYFELEDLGAFTIKGASAPLRVYALRGSGRLRTRFDLARARGLSDFVGRGAELAALEAASAATAAGDAPIAGIVAPAGSGKSRLCLEVAERWRARGVAVIETEALAHGTAVPYLPVLTLFRRLLGIGDRDAADAVRQKIAGGLLLLDERFTPRLPVLFELLGHPDPARDTVPLDANTRLAAVVDACAVLLRARAVDRMAVLLVEDLHWLDAASDAFLRRLVAALAGTRVLPVLNFRPEYNDGWLRAEPRYRRLALQPLADADLALLLDQLLGHDPSLGDLAAQLRARAGGNPFFAEELVLTLAQSGTLAGVRGAYRLVGPVDAAAIPSSVQGVLAARIDRLPGREKEVLQTAAVIGNEFSAAVLRAITPFSAAELDAALDGLARAELIMADPGAAAGQCAFKHPLIEEVAYATQLAPRRAELHAATAAALMGERGDLSAARTALIAYHWEKGGDARQAAEWHRRAAHALAASDAREALRRLQHVLALLRTVSAAPPAVTLALEAADDLLRVGTLAGLPLAEGEQIFAEIRALAERSDQREMLPRLLGTFGEFLMLRGRSPEAHARLAEAAALAATIDDQRVHLGVALDRAQSAFWAGHLRDTLAHIDEATPYIREGSAHGTIAVGLSAEGFLLALHGLCLTLCGNPRQGMAELDKVVRVADAAESFDARSIAYQFRSIAALTAGEYPAAVSGARTAAELAARAGNPFLERMSQSALGYAYAYAGQPGEALHILEPMCADVAAVTSLGMLGWYAIGALAMARLRSDDADGALAAATQAVELAGTSEALVAECNAQLVLAEALATARGPAGRDGCAAALARAETLIVTSGAYGFRPRWHVTRAACARPLGEDDAVRSELTRALRLATEMGMDALVAEIAGMLRNTLRPDDHGLCSDDV